jgi:hypothetical protein
MEETGRVGLPKPGGGGLLLGCQRAQLLGWTRRFFFADDAADFIKTGLEQPPGIEGCFAGQQFIKQHAQTVNIAARVNVQPAHLRLLRTHVGRGANELFEAVKTVLSVSVWPVVALAMPKSMILGTGTPS